MSFLFMKTCKKQHVQHRVFKKIAQKRSVQRSKWLSFLCCDAIAASKVLSLEDKITSTKSIHHPSFIPSVHYQDQYNVVWDYICKLWVIEVRDVVLLCLFYCNIYFSVHQYQLVAVYSWVCAYSLVTVSGCNKPSNSIATRGFRDKRSG